MKKIISTTALALALLVSAGVQAADKIAIVNISSIFQQLPQRESVAKQLENEFKGRASELQSEEQNIQSQMQRLQRDGSTMKTSERSSLEKEIMTRRKAFAVKAQAFEQDNHRRQSEERNKILSHIRNAVKKVADAQGIDVVIDESTIVYSSKANNITADVLKQVK